jgi:heme exporter protein B
MEKRDAQKQREITMIIAMIKKEFSVEARNASDVLSIVFFDVILTFIFSTAYAIGTGFDGMPIEVFAVQTWIIGFFTVLFVVSKHFPREKESGTLNGLLVSPISPSAIFFCKIIIAFAIIGLIEAVQFLLSLFISRPQLDGISLYTISNFVLGGFVLPIFDLAVSGTLISAFSMYARQKSFLLPVLLFPILLPIVAPTLSSFIILLGGGPIIAAVYDLLFIAAHAILLLSIIVLAGKEILIE